MSRHLHEQHPILNDLQVVIIQSPADSAPTTAGMTKKLSPTTTEWALPTESILRPTPSQADFTDPVPDTLPPVQRTMQSAPADSVCHVENQDQGNVRLVTYMSKFQV
jgi:hypothetical protein